MCIRDRTQVAHALSAVHAIDTGIVEEIKADFDLAIAVRLPGELGKTGPRGQLRARMMGHQPVPPGAYTFSGLGARRVVPVGQVIRIRTYDTRGAVSYTHLDVYKRQIPDYAECSTHVRSLSLSAD